jgi:transcriptional regulator with XRE-family HTH domain
MVAGDIELAYGRSVSRLRRRMGLGQEAFAYKANINRTYMTDIELGRRSVGIGVTQKICQALNVSLVEFAVELTNQIENLKREPK